MVAASGMARPGAIRTGLTKSPHPRLPTETNPARGHWLRSFPLCSHLSEGPSHKMSSQSSTDAISRGDGHGRQGKHWPELGRRVLHQAQSLQRSAEKKKPLPLGAAEASKT